MSSVSPVLILCVSLVVAEHAITDTGADVVTDAEVTGPKFLAKAFAPTVQMRGHSNPSIANIDRSITPITPIRKDPGKASVAVLQAKVTKLEKEINSIRVIFESLRSQTDKRLQAPKARPGAAEADLTFGFGLLCIGLGILIAFLRTSGRLCHIRDRLSGHTPVITMSAADGAELHSTGSENSGVRSATFAALQPELLHGRSGLSALAMNAAVPNPPSLPPVELIKSLVAAGAARSDPELSSAVKALVMESTPPATVDFATIAGTWRVINAPHIDTLSSVLFTSFSPIEYVLGADGTIASYVRYSGLPGNGWLCTDGSIANEPDGRVKIVWDRIWWAPSAADEPPAFDEGAFGPLVQAIGKVGFIESLSVFPVRHVGQELAVFNFQSFTVTAQRQ